MTVKQLCQDMTADELIEWVAYDQLDPIGGYRQDLQTAHLLYAQCGGDDKAISDFLPIDPNPMTDEMREQVEIARHKAELDACMQRLIAKLGND